MEKGFPMNEIDDMAKVIAQNDHLEDVRLEFYENRQLTRQHFQNFLNALA